MKIHEAIFVKRGINSKLTTFKQKSAVITETTPQLGLDRQQNDEEVKKSANIKILPLMWIQADEGTQADLFNFFRLNLD